MRLLYCLGKFYDELFSKAVQTAKAVIKFEPGIKAVFVFIINRISESVFNFPSHQYIDLTCGIKLTHAARRASRTEVATSNRFMNNRARIQSQIGVEQRTLSDFIVGHGHPNGRVRMSHSPAQTVARANAIRNETRRKSSCRVNHTDGKALASPPASKSAPLGMADLATTRKEKSVFVQGIAENGSRARPSQGSIRAPKQRVQKFDTKH
jgi:hypothetical protein